MVKNFKYAKLVYESINALLAIVAFTLAFLDLIGSISIVDSKSLIIIENAILLIFSIDYFYGLFTSQNKKQYVGRHIFDLIAIIPFNSFFRAFRIIRTIRIVQIAEIFHFLKIIRIFVFANKVRYEISSFLKLNGFMYIILVNIAILFFGAVGIYYTEYNYSVNSFGDALWWSIVTATTVGYGDIAPITPLGRIIASLLMITGTTFIGLYIGTITTYFINKKAKPRIYGYKKIDISYLNKEEIEEVMDFIDFIINRREK